MPWWGWLIAAGLLLLCATVVTVVTVMTRSMRKMSSDWDTEHDEWRKRHGFGGRR